MRALPMRRRESCWGAACGDAACVRSAAACRSNKKCEMPSACPFSNALETKDDAMRAESYHPCAIGPAMSP